MKTPSHAGASKGTHGDAKCVTKILGGAGGKNKEVVGGEFKFGQLNLRKIIKIVVIRCHILRLKQTKFDFDWGSDPDPAGGTHSHSTPTDPSGGFKGSYF